MSLAENRLAAGRISQLTARDMPIVAAPQVVADGAPSTVMVNFHPPFGGGAPAHQAQIPCAGRIVVPNGDRHILDTVTLWAVSQFAVVKVRVDGVAVTAVPDVPETVTVTVSLGCVRSTTS